MAKDVYIEKYYDANGNLLQVKYYSDQIGDRLLNLKKIENYTYLLDENTQEIIEKTIITDYYKGDEIIESETIKEYINK